MVLEKYVALIVMTSSSDFFLPLRLKFSFKAGRGRCVFFTPFCKFQPK